MTNVEEEPRLELTCWRDAPQSAVGTYTLTVGPNVTDLAGNAMDQDQDGTTPGRVRGRPQGTRSCTLWVVLSELEAP